MPKFRYTGTATMRLSGTKVLPGQIVEAPLCPSKHFEPVRDMASRTGKGAKSGSGDTDVEKGGK